MFLNSSWHHRLSILLSMTALSLVLAACGGSDNPSDPANPTPLTEFALNVQVNGAGSVQSDPAGLTCSSTCTVNTAAATTITLTVQKSIGPCKRKKSASRGT